MAGIPGEPPPPPPPPPAGTPPGAGGMRPRAFGEIFSAAFEIYKENFTKLITIVAIVVVPLTLISALIVHLIEPDLTVTTDANGFQHIETRSFGTFVLAALIAAAITVIISAILQAATIRGAALATVGDPVDIEASYKYGLKRFGSVILVGLLVGIVVAIGFVLLVIPGIIFLTFLAVAIPALVIENRRGTDAMKRSWNLVSSNFWHVLGVIVVAFLITAVVGGILRSIGGSNWFVAWIFNAIAQIITAPFAALVSVLLYLDLRARKEALTADSLRSELAANQ
jgi:hypothetical protein